MPICLSDECTRTVGWKDRSKDLTIYYRYCKFHRHNSRDEGTPCETCGVPMAVEGVPAYDQGRECEACFSKELPTCFFCDEKVIVMHVSRGKDAGKRKQFSPTCPQHMRRMKEALWRKKRGLGPDDDVSQTVFGPVKPVTPPPSPWGVGNAVEVVRGLIEEEKVDHGSLQVDDGPHEAEEEEKKVDHGSLGTEGEEKKVDDGPPKANDVVELMPKLNTVSLNPEKTCQFDDCQDRIVDGEIMCGTHKNWTVDDMVDNSDLFRRVVMVFYDTDRCRCTYEERVEREDFVPFHRQYLTTAETCWCGNEFKMSRVDINAVVPVNM